MDPGACSVAGVAHWWPQQGASPRGLPVQDSLGRATLQSGALPIAPPNSTARAHLPGTQGAITPPCRRDDPCGKQRPLLLPRGRAENGAQAPGSDRARGGRGMRGALAGSQAGQTGLPRRRQGVCCCEVPLGQRGAALASGSRCARCEPGPGKGGDGGLTRKRNRKPAEVINRTSYCELRSGDTVPPQRLQTERSPATIITATGPPRTAFMKRGP